MQNKIKQPALSVHDLTVSYDDKPVLWGINVDLPQGELIGIIGPNGGGKTTFLKSVMGLIPVDSGSVYFLNETIDQVRKKIAYMPQRQSIDWQFPILVREVVMMGRYPHINLLKRGRELDREKVTQALQLAGIEEFADRQIGRLSGGQQQRVFIARALAQEATIYLMDEPFAGVDAATTKLILDILKSLTKEGKTVIMIHHTLESIQAYCSYSVLINTYVHAAGPTQQVLIPKHLKSTYGSELNVLHDVRDLLGYTQLPILKENTKSQ
ncbi:MAG: ABC transporter ATP-binding protein [Bacteroidota bacterium]